MPRLVASMRSRWLNRWEVLRCHGLGRAAFWRSFWRFLRLPAANPARRCPIPLARGLIPGVTPDRTRTPAPRSGPRRRYRSMQTSPTAPAKGTGGTALRRPTRGTAPARRWGRTRLCRRTEASRTRRPMVAPRPETRGPRQEPPRTAASTRRRAMEAFRMPRRQMVAPPPSTPGQRPELPGDGGVDAAPDGGPSCGGPGELCCPGSTCRNGGCCAVEKSDRKLYCVGEGESCQQRGGTCQAGSCGGCGALDQECCKGACTGPSARCQFDSSPWTCIACGGKGQPCCLGPPGNPHVCTAPGMGCGADDVCAPCGAEGLTCCDLRDECPTGTGCDGDRICRRCGGLGQLCCEGVYCPSGAVCDANAHCQTCGGLGELCCEGQTCKGSSICFPLEPPDPIQQPALCRPCGARGQPCCTGRSCRSPATCTGGDPFGVCT